MRELASEELINITGGKLTFFDSAKNFYDFLQSNKNPLNGATIGGGISTAIGNIMYPVINSVISLLSSFIRK